MAEDGHRASCFIATTIIPQTNGTDYDDDSNFSNPANSAQKSSWIFFNNHKKSNPRIPNNQK